MKAVRIRPSWKLEALDTRRVLDGSGLEPICDILPVDDYATSDQVIGSEVVTSDSTTEFDENLMFDDGFIGNVDVVDPYNDDDRKNAYDAEGHPIDFEFEDSDIAWSDFAEREGECEEPVFYFDDESNATDAEGNGLEVHSYLRLFADGNIDFAAPYTMTYYECGAVGEGADGVDADGEIVSTSVNDDGEFIAPPEALRDDHPGVIAENVDASSGAMVFSERLFSAKFSHAFGFADLIETKDDSVSDEALVL